MRSVLFLCTGNFYRSRFAAAVFNALATEADLAWRADSRGLRLTDANVGSISPLALAGLAARGIAAEAERLPIAVTLADLTAADLVIAVSVDEHRPMLTQAFPDWAARATYWQVEDLHLTPAHDALSALESEVRRLVEQLHSFSTG